MNNVTLVMALLMGFTGSLHCAGMCGPIIWVMPFQVFGGWKKAIALAFYHIGRISVYAAMAVILHSFRNLFDPRVQQYVSIGLGSLLLLTGIFSFIPAGRFQASLPWVGFVKKRLGQVMGRPGLGAIGVAGMLNGLLPCGLVYMALSASLAAGGALQTITFMYVFGLGTLPMLLSITLLKTRISLLRTGYMKRLVPITVFAFGCLFLLRGLNLGIPYLSPKVAVEQHGIKSCCCHRVK